MKKQKRPWYKIKEVLNNVWHISDNGWDSAHLVIGKSKALLIDTTWGVGNFLSAVKSITHLPVSVVLTHGHADHAGGCFHFPEVYITRPDLGLLKSAYTPKTRKQWANSFSETLISQGLSPEKWGKARLGTVKFVSDGDRFDLGGRILRVIAIPGHTAGSIALYEEENGLLFTGDTLLEGDVFLHTQESVPLPVFLKSMEKLDGIRGNIRHVLPGHFTSPVSPQIIETMKKGVTDILSGKRKGRLNKDGARRLVLGKMALIFRNSSIR